MPPRDYSSTVWFRILKFLHLPYAIKLRGFAIHLVAAYGIRGEPGWSRPAVLILDRRRLPLRVKLWDRTRPVQIPVGRRYWDQDAFDRHGKCPCCNEPEPCTTERRQRGLE